MNERDELVCARLAPWLEARIGLHFPRAQWPQLRRRLDEVRARLGCDDLEACARHLLHDPPSHRDCEILAECLAVGETYFFRDAAVFEQLAQQVIEPLLAQRRTGSRALRLWSAGCSSGEEAWTLAIVVAGLLPDWREWDVAIVATDLNAAALEKARRGLYRAWSLRTGVPAWAQRFFARRADGACEVHRDLRHLVQFRCVNLADEREVAGVGGAMDVILCRNVLLYFEPARRSLVLSRLGQALNEGGWLVTNPVEIPHGGVEGLSLAAAPGLVALRRGEPAPAPPRSDAPACVARERPWPARPPITRAGSMRPERTEAPAATLAGSDDDEARCRQAIEQHKLDPQWTYRLSCILSDRGALEESVEALRRTLYLAPDHILARFAMGSITARRGDAGASRRHFSIALARLGEHAPGDVLEGSGGVTAAELERVIRSFGVAAR